MKGGAIMFNFSEQKIKAQTPVVYYTILFAFYGVSILSLLNFKQFALTTFIAGFVLMLFHMLTVFLELKDRISLRTSKVINTFVILPVLLGLLVRFIMFAI